MRLRTPATAAVLAAGLLTSAVVTAAPLAASEPMSTKLHKLRLCESGDHYAENTHNGYYGAYQFAAGTWRSMGYHGMPNDAKAKTQNHAARRLHASQGWSPWPSCAREEHL